MRWRKLPQFGMARAITDNGAQPSFTVAGGSILGTVPNLTATSLKAVGDRFIVLNLAVIGGADTVLTTCSVNGTSAMIATQVNVAGYIAAIVYLKTSDMVHLSTFRVVINSTGTAPASALATVDIHQGMNGNGLVSAVSSSDTVNTALTGTLDVFGSLCSVSAVAINDIGAANSCTWTGTLGLTETRDAAIGAGRASMAAFGAINPTQGAGRTAIATFAVVSTVGIALAVAVFR